jgi:hydroxymethylbilane synthase
MNHALMGGCQVPIAGYATLQDGVLALEGRVGAIDGSQLLRASATAPADQAEALGLAVAQQLRAQGAEALLQPLMTGH